MASRTCITNLGRRAAVRTVQPHLTPARITKRFLDTSTAPILYSAHAKVVGARTGHVEGDDLNVDLTMAKALGGSGDK
jgi:hypothetical protein